MSRYCAACGTEVEDTAVFCPTCGKAIDQEHEAEIPEAPAWPDQLARRVPAADGEREPVASQTAWPEEAHDDARGESDGPRAPAYDPRREEPTHVEDAPPVQPLSEPRSTPRTSPPPAAAGRRPGPSLDLPLTMPVMLSGWLIGVGALIAMLGVVVGLFGSVLNPIDLIMLILLLGIAATVFLPSRVPDVPHLRLTILVTVLIAFGMALDRIGIGGAGVGELLLFFGAAAAGIGAIILELGRDQPLGGSQT
ncbi:MAG: zinc-ribbon domain-containing protein [Candidatus Limnocylindria bacterium]